MYAYFKGIIADVSEQSVILEVNNIGYNIMMPSSECAELRFGDDVQIYTFTYIREDAMNLFGFLNRQELDFFKLLLTVSGIGPKVALGMLSNTSVEDIQMSIIAQDSKAISKLPGIGAKTAGRIILELKDKVSPTDLINVEIKSTGKSGATNNAVKQEALEALMALGIGSSQAMKAINQVDFDENTKVEDIVRQALINI